MAAEKKKEDTPKPAEVKAAERVVSNIPAKLKESFSSGTAARAVTKAWAAKAGKIATWTTVILMALVLVFDTIPYYMEGGSTPKVASSSQQQAPAPSTPATQTTNPQPSTREGKMTWKETAQDGSLPVDIWSETFKIPVGCTVFYSSGNGKLYEVQTRFSHEKTWSKHIPGQINAGEEIQFKILEAGRGMKTAPISIKC